MNVIAWSCQIGQWHRHPLLAHVCIRMQPTDCWAALSSALHPGSNDKSPSQPVLIGVVLTPYTKARREVNDCVLQRRLSLYSMQECRWNFLRSENGDDHPSWKYMTWPTEALSPIWKPNCKAKSKVRKKQTVTVCLVISLPLSLTSLHNTILSIKPQEVWNKCPSPLHVLVGSAWTVYTKGTVPLKIVDWLSRVSVTVTQV